MLSKSVRPQTLKTWHHVRLARHPFFYMQILTGKGVVTAADITAHIEELESYGGRGLGPRVIARAWSDPEYKKRLLEDGVAGVTELGIEAGGWKPYGGVTGKTILLRKTM